jgi:ribose transport system ATP-binding protein
MLKLTAISKSFPGVKALTDVSLEFMPGEIHGLVGENGAGKSTLMKIMTGLLQPDQGTIQIDSQTVQFRNCLDAMARGIHLVYQEIQVIPESTIAENVMLDKLITRGRSGIIDWPAVNHRARIYTERIGLKLPVTTVVKHLSAAQKQLIQIARALAAETRLLLLDEPTSSLSGHEAAELMAILRLLKGHGVTIVYVSHKLEEVFAIADRVSVLRDGQWMGTRRAADLTRTELVQMMIGRAAREDRLGPTTIDRSREALRVQQLHRTGKAHDINFVLHPGEILGFYGLVGSGRTETARLIIGDDQRESGELFVNGERARISSVQDSLHRYRIGYVSENRKEEGLWLDASVGTNITITILQRLIHRLTRRIDPVRERQTGQDLTEALAIKTPGLDQTARFLSGGNQQKICLAKWLAAQCDILIIDEPTVGVDVGAKEHLHRLIWELAAQQQKAILLISSDMTEIIKLASRILVFKDHRIVGEITDVSAPTRNFQEISQEIGEWLS